MACDIKSFIRSFHQCQMRKSLQKKGTGHLQQFSSPEPFHTVGIDIFGPLPRTTIGNRYVVVIVDRFSRWLELAAVPDITAETMAEVLVDRIVLRHGCPRRLLSDRGSQFTSQLFKEVSARLGIKKIFTSAYHPQTNGQVERMNRYIAAALSAYVNENQTDWDEYLETIAFSYRTSVVDAIGNTPFYLVHGRDARLPTEISEDLDGSVREDVYQYGVDLTKRIGEAFTLAKESQEKSDAARKKLYDAKHQPVALDEGTLVLLHSPLHKPGLSPKLAPKFQGPYRVVSQESPVLYQIRHLQSGKVTRVHIQRLIPFYRQHEWDEGDSEGSDTEDEAETAEDTDNDDRSTDHLSVRTPDEESEGEAASGRPRRSTAGKTTAQSSDILWNY